MTDIQAPTPYRVLARKYRPTDFSGLIGQDALVRTLTNAIATGRLAHAFVLTGVRGVGKTTTARIIARALTCVGADGQGGPTVAPCGVCEHCRSIAEDRHVDVMEMDAASRTGVGDIRELIESVRYRPTSARFKIYIIDEVHMLSTPAFNALLKTLEEPPEHVKFIFATTEIRKIPVTVLSRCQRFDLRRVEMDVLVAHFAAIARQEGAQIDASALAMIARAADGSVRDGLSLLDQAIAHGAGAVGEAHVRDMLGLADRARVFDLFDAVMRGDIKDALDQFGSQYALGADPAVILQDMLELTHWLTRLKIVPDQADGMAVAETERVRGGAMAAKLSMATLTRAWQMLLKGLGETRAAPAPQQAAEMCLVRLAYAAELPSPADLVEQIRKSPPATPAPRGAGPAPSGGGGAALAAVAAPQPAPTPASAPAQPVAQALPTPASLVEVVALLREKRESVLSALLTTEIHLVHFEVGRIEFRPAANAPSDLAPRLGKALAELTGRRWMVSVANAPGAPTLKQQAEAAALQQKQDALADPLVQAILAAFPDAKIDRITDIDGAAVDSDDGDSVAAADPAFTPDGELTLGEDEA